MHHLSLRAQQAGSFVFMASRAGPTGNVGHANGMVAKRGAWRLMRATVMGFERLGVRLNCNASLA